VADCSIHALQQLIEFGRFVGKLFIYIAYLFSKFILKSGQTSAFFTQTLMATTSLVTGLAICELKT